MRYIQVALVADHLALRFGATLTLATTTVVRGLAASRCSRSRAC